MKTFLHAGAGALFLLLTVVSVASAHVFTVAAPGASGSDSSCTPCKTIAGAIAKAGTPAMPGADSVVIPAGTYNEELTISSTNPVYLTGAGSARTVLRDPLAGNGMPALQLGAAVVVSGMSITGSGSTVVGMTAGTLSGVSIASTSTTFIGQVLDLDSTNGAVQLTAVSVSAPLDGSGGTAIALGDAASSITFDRVTASGSNGIAAAGGSGFVLVMRRSVISGYSSAMRDDASGTAAVRIEDSVLRVRGSGGTAFGIADTSLAGTYKLDSVTMYAQPGLTGTHGIDMTTADGDARTVNVYGTIFDNFAYDTFSTFTTGGGTPPSSSVNIGTSRLDQMGAQHGFAGAGDRPVHFTGTPITNDPNFVSPTTGDFRLKPISSMIDRGQWATLPAGREIVDLRGVKRLADGNKDNQLRTDIGAYEYQAGPKQLSPAGVPVRVLGSMRVASNATCDPGAWIYTEGLMRTFAWYRGRRRITGQHKQHYRLRKGDFKKSVSCQVIFTSADTVTNARSHGRRVVSRFAETGTPLNNN